MKEYLYMRIAYAALIIIFLFCGILRCSNPWKLTSKELDKLYPARRHVATAYFAVLLLLPCATHPSRPDTQLLAHCFWVLYIPAITSLAFKQYFFHDEIDNRRWLRLAIVGGIPAMITLALAAFACTGGLLSAPHRLTLHAVKLAGFFLTAYQLHVSVWVWHRAVQSKSMPCGLESNNYPRRFSFCIVAVSTVSIIATWVAFFINTPTANAILTGSITLAGMGILITILHPQREKAPLHPAKTYMNQLRMEHAISYAAQHPNAKQAEIAQNSGFGSVKTYTRTKSRYENTPS